MQKDSKRFEDIARLFSGAAGAAMDARHGLESLISDKIERIFARGNFVTRSEFELVKAMAEKARQENDALRKEIETLKQR